MKEKDGGKAAARASGKDSESNNRVGVVGLRERPIFRGSNIERREI